MPPDASAVEQRRRDRFRVLAHYLDLARDQYAHGVSAAIDDPPLKDISIEVFRELAQEGWLDEEDRSDPPRFSLTNPGWHHAHEETGRIKDLDIRDRPDELRRIFNDAKREAATDPAFLSEEELRSKTSIPFTWIANAVRSELLAKSFPGRYMRLEVWQDEQKGLGIRIPHAFDSA